MFLALFTDHMGSVVVRSCVYVFEKNCYGRVFNFRLPSLCSSLPRPKRLLRFSVQIILSRRTRFSQERSRLLDNEKNVRQTDRQTRQVINLHASRVLIQMRTLAPLASFKKGTSHFESSRFAKRYFAVHDDTSAICLCL